MTTMTKTEEKIKILLVEDNPADVRLASLALNGSDLSHELRVLSNGESAVDYLKQSGPYADVPHPHIVFLDLNLPRLNGMEILTQMRSDPALRHIPVVVLSVSDSPEIIRDAYDAGANLYITKPVNLDRFSFMFQYVSEVFKDGKFAHPGLPPPDIPFGG